MSGGLEAPHNRIQRYRLPDVRTHLKDMCSGSEAGSFLRLIDSCVTQLKAQGLSRTCNESKEEAWGRS